ncbi:MAG: hypothetical protein KGM24_06995 [Elusimicrobia bacterium]|nr:hypothetical protein [Elusimicrobiota bacterium]
MTNEFAPQRGPSRKTLVLSLLGLAAFLAVEALLMRRFVRVDTRPPSWDQADQLEIALDYRQALGAGRWSDFWYLAPKPGMPPFPPAYQLMLRGAYSSPDPAHAALWVNWWYLSLLAVSIFFIAWRFLPDSRALAATLAFCAAPVVQRLYSTQLVDLPLAALVATAYWALLESDGFSRWGPSLAFAGVYALGMLHKWSFFSYLLPAYVIAARALGDRRARPKVLAAAGLSLALFSPWYWAHLALLPSRLAQASSDFGVPFWKDGAWAAYFSQSCGALGPFLWALGFIGLLAPQYARRRENAWVIVYWIVFSYVFWTIVPNRQIRFLLPALPPLALALAASFPRPVVWGVAAVQLVGAVNFFFGWIGPLRVPAPYVAMDFFENAPPAAENWQTEPILRRIEADRDPTRPITNVTLVGNDAYFNATTFHWAQRWLDLPHSRIRGVNKRLCELSEFVLLKDGKLGPPSVIGGLQEAADQIKDPNGWFASAYREDARWPLPDGSTAILYRQRRRRPDPMPSGRVAYNYFSIGGVEMSGLKLSLKGWDPARSDWSDATASVDQLSDRGLVLHGLKAEASGLSFVPIYEDASRRRGLSDVRLLRLDSLKIDHLEVDQDDLKAFLSKRVPGLRVDAVTLDGTIKAVGDWHGKPVSLEAALDLDRAARTLRIRIVSARYMGAELPTSLFRSIKELTVSLAPNPETPFAIDLPGLTIAGGRLTVP